MFALPTLVILSGNRGHRAGNPCRHPPPGTARRWLTPSLQRAFRPSLPFTQPNANKINGSAMQTIQIVQVGKCIRGSREQDAKFAPFPHDEDDRQHARLPRSRTMTHALIQSIGSESVIQHVPSPLLSQVSRCALTGHRKSEQSAVAIVVAKSAIIVNKFAESLDGMNNNGVAEQQTRHCCRDCAPV